VPGSTDPGVIKEFPKFDAVSVQNKPGKVTAQGVDLVNGKKVDASASNDTDPGRSTLGSHVIVFDKLGTHTKEERNAAAETTKATGARSDEEAKKDATADLAKSTGKASKGTLPIIGDPRIFAKDIIRIEQIGKRLSGNYYVYEAHHKVQPGNYTLDIKFRRDANNGSGAAAGGAADPSTTAGKPNDAKGTDPNGTATKTEPKIVYDKLGGHNKVQFAPTSNKGSS
jgi:phage protein D